jgi:uncharacterized membrane protein YhhN
MSDDGPVANDNPTALIAAAVLVVAIVLLLLFARGPEEQDRSLAPPVTAFSVAIRA